MGLAEAIAYAKAHQPAIRTAMARIAARKSAADVPRAAWLPRFGVTAQLFGATANQTTASYVTVDVPDLPRIGGTRAVSKGTFRPYASTLAGIGANQEVFDFGRIAAEAAAADALVDVERERAASTALDVTFDVEEAYFAVFASKSIVQASEDAYERARVHRDLAKAGVTAGLRPPIELTRAESELTKLDIGRMRARGNLATAETVLAAVVGAPDSALDVASSPPNPAEMPSLADAIERASARDPRLRAALSELHAEEARTRAIGASLRPDLSATGTFSGRAGGATPSSGPGADGSGFIPNVPNWDVGLVLTWPLFDGVVNARESASRAEEQVRREEMDLVRQEDVAVVREAYVAVDVAREALPGLRRAVDAAKANYDQADARFRAGLGTSVELADAEALRTDADIQLALGQFELARARAAFGRSIAEGP
ncbi:MAG TPA: TolC family protein [Polyangiaceae bacterium]|nr:TolC family protein [Polyangiaceae bacterium]